MLFHLILHQECIIIVYDVIFPVKFCVIFIHLAISADNTDDDTTVSMKLNKPLTICAIPNNIMHFELFL